MEGEVIICITGESGSGKSEIANYLIKKGYNKITEYTTREQRYEGEPGYVFIDLNNPDDNKIYQDMLSDTLEGLTFKDYFDENWYWSTRDFHVLSKKNVYCINPNSIKSMKKRLRNAHIYVIYLKVDEFIRRQRMKERVNLKNSEVEDNIIRKRINYEKEENKVIECDFVLDNNGHLNETFDNLNNILHLINEKETL